MRGNILKIKNYISSTYYAHLNLFKNYKYHGRGRLINSKGEYFEGIWEDGEVN